MHHIARRACPIILAVLVTLTGCHTAEINRATTRPTLRLMAENDHTQVFADGNLLLIVDRETGDSVELDEHTSDISRVALDRDLILTADDNTFCIWDWTDWKRALRHKIRIDAKIHAVALKGARQWAAVGDNQGRVQIFDTERGTLEWRHWFDDEEIAALRFLSGRRPLARDVDGFITARRLINLRFEQPHKVITALSFDTEGRLFIGDSDGALTIHDFAYPETYRLREPPLGEANPTIYAISWREDGLIALIREGEVEVILKNGVSALSHRDGCRAHGVNFEYGAIDALCSGRWRRWSCRHIEPERGTRLL